MKPFSRSAKNTSEPAWLATPGAFGDNGSLSPTHDPATPKAEAVLAMHNEAMRNPEARINAPTAQESMNKLGEEVVRAAEIIVASEPNKPE
ncbi:MAG TPA: hypothetical protein VMR95_00310 [Candidatus Binatia bacterium]|jgi:hypothetical protein|nr:hypothetical protein [Candidatus Binatia bacterium]